MIEIIYTVEEVADLLNLKATTIRTWLKGGKLIGTKLGKSWRISDEDLKKLFPETSFSPFYDSFKTEKPPIVVYGNEPLYEKLYPEAFKQYQDATYHPDPWEDYKDECQRILDRRFPYPYTDENIFWNSDHTSYYEGTEPEIYWKFYNDKHKEETAKLNSFMQMLKEKYKVPDEDITEIQITYENLQLLKIAKLIYEI